MKYALFNFFVDNSCALGETRWILDEESSQLNNNKWIFHKEVIVDWPCDYQRYLKKIMKGSVDISQVESKKWAAKIVKFSGKILFVIRVCLLLFFYQYTEHFVLAHCKSHVKSRWYVTKSYGYETFKTSPHEKRKL